MPILIPACLRGRLREQNNCSDERKHGSEFLLHHHSTGYKVARPIACTRRDRDERRRIQGGPMRPQNDFRRVRTCENFCDQYAMLTRITELVELEAEG